MITNGPSVCLCAQLGRQSGMEDSPRHIVLYRVHCAGRALSCQGYLYQVEPSTVLVSGESHLGGPWLTLDLQTRNMRRESPLL
jgi:hypothetical protein